MPTSVASESSRCRPPPSSFQLVPVTRIEKRSSNEQRRQLGLGMANRVGSSPRENQNFPMTGRPPDRDWMDTKRIRPTWTGNEARNTMDSGIELTENRYGPLPLQPGDGNATWMTIRYGECMLTYQIVQEECRGMVHTNVYYLSQRTQIVLYREVIHSKPNRDGPRMTCAQIRLNTEGHLTTETVSDYGYLVRRFSRECLSYSGI